MIHELTIKDPDSIGDFLEQVRNHNRPPLLTDDEWEAVKEVRSSKPSAAMKWLEGFFEYGEYLEIHFDDVNRTATVIRKK
jgi:hypothetical protein